MPALIVGIESHLRALVATPLQACEVCDLEQRMIGEEALRTDDPEALRARLRAEIAWSGRPRSTAERRADYEGVDREALETVARRHLGRPPIVVLVGDEDLLRRALAIALPERRVERFDAEIDDLE